MMPRVPTTKKSKRSASKAKASPPKNRKVMYDKLEGRVGWLSASQAKTFLGWKQSEADKPYVDYLLKDRHGVPTKCFNVDKQRPFYTPTVLQYMGDILGGHWNGDGGESNGESIAIGATGLCIEGKHRLAGLVLAEQEWLLRPEKYTYWKEEPKIHCFINLGVREDMVSINTINTGKPRSLGDAIYASGLFGEMNGSKSEEKRRIKILSKMADYAVRLLWHRTGARKDAFAPKRSHAESLDFIQRHPKLLECVKHIYEENGKDDRLKFYPSPGYASALLYLMGSCATVRENDEGTGYIQVGCPTEDLLDWSMWDTAYSFWTELAGQEKSMDALRQGVGNLLDSESGGYRNERLALVVKSWWQYHQDLEITENAIELDMVTDPDGISRLAELPTVGEMVSDVSSIDTGEPTKE